MSTDLFLTLLLFSVFICLALTEAIKTLLVATDTPHRSNVIALICAFTSSTLVGIIYRVPFGLELEGVQVLRLVKLILTTWFSTMLVYDKLDQLGRQHRKYKNKKRGK